MPSHLKLEIGALVHVAFLETRMRGLNVGIMQYDAL